MEREQLRHAFLHSASGDALGYIAESDRSSRRIINFRDFKAWKGGRYNGYQCPVNAGDYTDDTEYTIGVAHCILGKDKFVPGLFEAHLAYYGRYGTTGGQSTKLASAKLNKQKKHFSYYDSIDELFYDADENVRAYWEQKGTGVLMRISPIAFSMPGQSSRMNAVFENGILTHGSPEALLVAAVHCELLRRLYANPTEEVHIALGNVTAYTADRFMPSSDLMSEWMSRYQSRTGHEFRKDCEDMLSMIIKQVKHANLKLYEHKCILDSSEMIRAVSACASSNLALDSFIAAYLLSHLDGTDREKLLFAANSGKSLRLDTDTVCALLGQMVGVRMLEGSYNDLEQNVQDTYYLKYMADAMHSIENKSIEIKRALAPDWRKTMSAGCGMWHPLFGGGQVLEEHDYSKNYLLRRLVFNGKSILIKISKKATE